MSFKSTSAYTRLMPFRDYDEHSVVNLFSKDVTGVAGELVKIVRSNPSDTDGFSSSNVGAAFDGIVSLRYETKDKIKATAGGEKRWDILGITIAPTLETDENGLPLRYNPLRKSELQCVLSGESVPVLTKGLVMLRSSAYVGSPTFGYVAVPYSGGNGLIAAVNPADQTQFSSMSTFASDTGALSSGIYNSDQVIGKFLSNTGTFTEGVALLQLSL